MNASTHFELKSDQKTVFIFGGSQGSEALNNVVAKMVNEICDIQVLWQTGNDHYQKYDHLNSKSIRVKPFIDDMSSAFALADLSLSRAGALTIAELTACGVPSIFVPLPSAAADHQTHNARSVVNAGAGEIIPESELDPTKTSELIHTVLNDQSRLDEMSNHSKQLGRTDAASVIVDTILEKVDA